MNTLDQIKSSVANLKNVKFNIQNIIEFCKTIGSTDLTSDLNMLFYYKDWSLEDKLKITFYFNAINFCYWAEKNNPKWSIDFNGKALDGSVALIRLIELNLKENKNFLDAKHILDLSKKEFDQYLVSNNKTEIPLLDERYSHFINTADVLLHKFDDNFLNVLESSQYSIESSVETLTNNFESYKDSSEYNNNLIHFNKRSQLQLKVANDVLGSYNIFKLFGLSSLTAFADYKVPQILRHLGIIDYSQILKSKVDNLVLIEKDSVEELEIRIATIWAVELIKQELFKKFPNITAASVDTILWLKSQSVEGIMPYHRTYTTAY